MNEGKKYQYGFIKPKEDESNFVLGSSSLPQVELEPTGDWSKWVTDFESQLKQIEVYNCTGFATTNCLEILLNRLGIEANFSDRFLGIVAGTYPPGNDPATVANAIRKNGLIPESMLPFSPDLQSVDEYYSFKGADETKCREVGKKFLEEYDFGYEWVFKYGTPQKDKPALMLQALKYSPLGCSVNAWYQKDGLYYKPEGSDDSHWTMCVVGAVPNKYWIIADSYETNGATLKYLEWSYDFGFCQRYHISKKNISEQLSLMQKILNTIAQLVGVLWKKKFNTEPPKTVEEVKIAEKPLQPVKEEKYDKVIDYLLWAETRGGDDNAIGDKTLIYKAYGALQIRQPLVNDVNHIAKTHYRAEDCLGNRPLSLWMCEKYLDLYATKARIGREPTAEDMCRIWNGGPNGWKKQSTVAYWQSIKKQFKL